jgi:hypothetical protein
MFLENRTARRQNLRAPQDGQRQERRLEQRLRYFWPVWYSSDGSLDIQQGRMIDLSSGGVSFVAQEGTYPDEGQQIWLRSSYPLVQDGGFGMASFSTVGRVLRKEVAGTLQSRLAVKFEAPLEYCPAEIAGEAVPAMGPA